MMLMEKSELLKKIEELGPWFQNIKLDDVQTNSEMGHYPEGIWNLISPNIPEDLTGKTALDLGCNAGYVCTKLKERGAEVTGVERDQRFFNQAKFVAEYFDYDIEYLFQNVYDFVFKNKKKFDYVIFSGLFYHLRYPLLVLDKLSEITKEKLIFHTVTKESYNKENQKSPSTLKKQQLMIGDNIPRNEKEMFFHDKFPKAFFIEKKMEGAISYWWLLNETGVYAVLRSSGFINIKRVGNSEFFVCQPNPNPKEHFKDDFDETGSYFEDKLVKKFSE